MRHDYFIQNTQWVATPTPTRPNWFHIVPVVLVGLAVVGMGAVAWVITPG